MTPVLYKLHWLPVRERIVFKILTYVYKILSGQAPFYFTDLIGIICMVPILRIYIGSIIIANFADHRFFTNLRKKHRDDFQYTDVTGKNNHNIIIDGSEMTICPTWVSGYKFSHVKISFLDPVFWAFGLLVCRWMLHYQ